MPYQPELHEENGWDDERSYYAVLTVEDRRFKVARQRPTTRKTK